MIARSRLIRLYSAFQFFFSLLWWLPVFYEYQKRMGLTDPQIFGIQGLYYLSFCVLEIPTGWIADRFGNRLCLRAGAALLAVANLLPVFFTSYGGFLAHFVLIALSRSLVSGASSAYLYEHLRDEHLRDEHLRDEHLRDRDLYKTAEGRARAYGLVGKVICWSLLGVLMRWHLSLPYTLSALSGAVAAAVAWSLPPDRAAPRAPGPAPRPLALGAREVLGILRSSPLLALVILQGVGVFVLDRVFQVNLFQPILQEKGIPLSDYGLMMALTAIFEAGGSAFPGWIRRYLQDFHAIFVLAAVMAASLWLIPGTGAAGTAACLCAYAAATGFAYPIQRQLLNDCIPDARYRATLLSLESLVDRAAVSCVMASLGGILARRQLDFFLHLSAAASLFGIAVIYILTLLRGSFMYKKTCLFSYKKEDANAPPDLEKTT